ncbi:MAG: ATP-binding protein [Anaerolineales bacterium]
MKENLIVAWSGGKDCTLALQEIQKTEGYSISALFSSISEEDDRVTMHGIPRKLLEAQARSLGYPLAVVTIPDRCSEEQYQTIMQQAMEGWQEHGITGVVFGDLYLDEIRAYREQNLEQIGLKAIFPLWGRDTYALSHDFINLGYRAVITCVDTDQLVGRFAGREYRSDLLDELPQSVDPCGENGEFHTFVYDGPIFSRRVAFKRGKPHLKQKRFNYYNLE